jgi:hypothetical protein
MDPSCPHHQPAFLGADELLTCSPLCSLLSPCGTADDDMAWAGKFTLAGALGATGERKRKAGSSDLTPCSSLADLTDCPGDARRAELAFTAPAFRCGT